MGDCHSKYTVLVFNRLENKDPDKKTRSVLSTVMRYKIVVSVRE